MKNPLIKSFYAILLSLFAIAFIPACITFADDTPGSEADQAPISQTAISEAAPTKDISGAKVTIGFQSYMFTGSPIEPSPIVKLNGAGLIRGKDYSAVYTNNTELGDNTACITITGKGNYSGTVQKTFSIMARTTTTCSISKISDQYYNGRYKRPEPVVKYGSYTFKNGVDYILRYTNNIESGTATVTIVGTNRLKGSKKMTFNIVPYNIKTDYGAKGDNVTNDYNAFKKACEYAKTMPENEKIEIYVPAGKYRIGTMLCFYSNTRLILDKNAELINDTKTKTFLTVKGRNGQRLGHTGYTEAHDITIEGGTINGNGNYQELPRGIVVFRNSQRITFKDCVFKKVYGSHYLICDGVSDLTVSGCTFTEYVPYTGNWWEYDFTKGTTTEAQRKSYIGAIEAVHIDYAEDGTPCKNVDVSNCIFNNVPAGVGTHHLSTQKAANISVHDNTFRNVWFSCMHACSFDNVTMYSNVSTNCGVLFRCEDSEADIYDNYFSGITKIDYNRYNANDLFYAILARDRSSINVYGNTLKNVVGSGMMISDSGSKVNNIYDNVIDSCTYNGMYINNSIVNMTYNEIKNCSRNGISAYTSKVTCTNNNILKCAVTFAYLAGGCYSSIVKDNGINTNTGCVVSSSSASVDNNKKAITDYTIVFSANQYYYTGKEIRPQVTVKSGSSVLSPAYYTVTYMNNKNIGTATVRVEGRGNYRGFIKRDFIIIPKPSTVSAVSSAKTITLSFTRSNSSSGYEVRYSKDKTFKTGVTTQLLPNTQTQLTISGLSTGDTWYVQYKPYVIINGCKYGNYSSITTVKVK